MPELGKKRDPGIKGWDPTKVGPQYKVVQHPCPYCWFAHRSKSVLTRHINEEHWREKEAEK